MSIYTELLRQFNASTGSNCKDIYDKTFKQWLVNYSIDIAKYIEFLEANGIDIVETNIAELDKGPFDSLLVRRAVDNIRDRLLTENALDIKVPKRKVKIHKKEVKVLINGCYYPLEDYEAYMSYNLLRDKQLERFSALHNNGKHIIYGVFGRNGDLDKRTKLEHVQNIYKNMNDGEFTLNYVENNGVYFYLVESKDGMKMRKLVR